MQSCGLGVGVAVVKCFYFSRWAKVEVDVGESRGEGSLASFRQSKGLQAEGQRASALTYGKIFVALAKAVRCGRPQVLASQ